MANRRCEQCGGAVPDRTSRQRNQRGQLVCEECKRMNLPEWNAATAHSSLDVRMQSEMRRRQAEAIVSISKVARLQREGHDSGDGAVINHCPFCLGGDTRYITKDGVKTFAETVGTTQWVLTANRNDRTGGRWVQAHIHEFGEQPLLRITLRRNKRTKVIEATPEHRWLVKSNKRVRVETVGQRSRKGMSRTQRFDTCARGHEYTEANTRLKTDGTRDCKTCATQAVPLGGVPRATDVDVLTKDLRPGMRLSYLRQQGVGDLQPSHDGIRHGVVFGDGTASGKYANVTLWGEKDKQLLSYFPNRRYHDDNTATRALGTGVPGVKVSGDLWSWMKVLPDLNKPETYLYGWLAGYFAADGTVSKQGQVLIHSANLAHLEAFRDIAVRLGIATYEITKKMRVGFPGAEPSALYSLGLVNSTLNEEFFLIEQHRDRFRFSNYAYDRIGWTVASVEETGKTETVYCAVVPETHSFALEGHIWTGNCGSGAVTKRNDGSAECDFCNNVFTVQVQPSNPNMPQTVDGVPTTPPGMPAGQEGTEISGTDDPAVAEDEDGVAANPLDDQGPASNGPVAPGQPPSKQPKAPAKADPSTNPGKGNDQPPWLRGKDKQQAPTKGQQPGAKPKKDLPPWLKSKKSSAVAGGDPSPLCTSCFEAVHDYTPEMGDGVTTFGPGTCARCGTSNETVFDFIEPMPPSLGSKTLRTHTGATLSTEDYMAHLALSHADDREAVLDMVRVANTQRQVEAVTWDDPSIQHYKDGTPIYVNDIVDAPGLGRCHVSVIYPESVMRVKDGKTVQVVEESRWWRDYEPGDPIHRFRPEDLTPIETVHQHFPHPGPPSLGSKQAAMPLFEAAGGLTHHHVRATEVREGDYLDSSGKVRVHTTHQRGDRVMIGWKLRGSRAPGVRDHAEDEMVHVWRRG